MDIRGTDMFARYTYAPNKLGYCGPAEAAALRSGAPAEVRAVAPRFSGVWPYLRVLSRMTGIQDPLDHRLVESYWLGGGVGAELDRAAFLAELLAMIGPLAGQYWAHLRLDLATEAAANHCFHVFGVYPWSRMLGRGMDEHPVHVLDNCRIGWGTVVSRGEAEVEVLSRTLRWTGRKLELTEPAIHRAALRTDGYSALPNVTVGADVAIHWGRLCGYLDAAQLAALEATTAVQLAATNHRLAEFTHRATTGR